MIFFSAIISSLIVGSSFAQVPDNALQLDFSVTRPASSDVVKRGDNSSVAVDLLNQNVIYNVIIGVGSHKEKQFVQLDTGSSDLWVMDSDVQCVQGSHIASSSVCLATGSFSPSNSLTFKSVSDLGEFGILYGDGTKTLGQYGLDTITIGKTIVPDLIFGIANQSSSSNPVFGIGLPLTESSYFSSQLTYPNFPMRLKELNLVKKNAYSLFLNTTNSLTGSVLFGAVDHKKYTGKLQTVPLVIGAVNGMIPNTPSRFAIVLDEVIINGAGVSLQLSNQTSSVILDSGSQSTYLPQQFVDALTKIFGLTNVKGTMAKQIACLYLNLNITLSFNFSGALIEIPLSNFIFSTQGVCIFGIRVASDDYILGDNFLSGAYVVYDLEDFEISLANASFNPGSDIEVISSAIPSAVRAPLYSQTSYQTQFTSVPASTALNAQGQTRNSGAPAKGLNEMVYLGIAFVSGLLML